MFTFLFYILEEVILEYFNPNFQSLVTPVNVKRYAELLRESEYDPDKTKSLINGFTHGFDLGYRGPTDVRLEANNLKLRVGSKLELWNKIMKEVKEGRFAGGFRKPPFKYFIQSPLGNCLCSI